MTSLWVLLVCVFSHCDPVRNRTNSEITEYRHFQLLSQSWPASKQDMHWVDTFGTSIQTCSFRPQRYAGASILQQENPSCAIDSTSIFSFLELTPADWIHDNRPFHDVHGVDEAFYMHYVSPHPAHARGQDLLLFCHGLCYRLMDGCP